jgi:type VI secretion system protein ImpK
MITATSEQLTNDQQGMTDGHYSLDISNANEQSLATAKLASDTQLLLTNKFVSHTPKSGLNPLVDASAYLFSIMGKLKGLKSYRHLTKLRKELMDEINQFQDVAKAHNYNSEYILVTRYALCATLDDIISNTAWGTQGQWDSHSLLLAFNQESIGHERFFILLERLIKDPHAYIDVMEFMYICLSLGFKGQYRSTEYNQNQLELITNALYKRIRAHRGDFSKILSPFPLRHHTPTVKSPTKKSMPAWLIILLSAMVGVVMFAGIRYLLNVTSNQAYQDLTRIGKSISYETHDQTTS